jgi:hypothetical protein
LTKWASGAGPARKNVGMGDGRRSGSTGKGEPDLRG